MKNLFYTRLFYTLFALSLGLNCAYVTGCCSFHFKTKSDCDGHPRDSAVSDDAETRLRTVAGKLHLFVPSNANAEQVQDIIVTAVSKQESFERGKLSDDVLSNLRKDASAASAEDDFDALCTFIEKADGKRILILEP